MPKTTTALTLQASASNAAGATTRSAVIDCSAFDGGVVRFAITNGATAPTAQCEARVMVARKQASTPAAAAEGNGPDDWKQVYVIGGGTVAGTRTRGNFVFGPEVTSLYVEFAGNAGQPVTVEASGTAYAYP